MIFTSVVFALFFIMVIILNYLLPVKLRWIWLLLWSIFFYTYSNPASILVVGFILLVTFYAAKKIENTAVPKIAFRYYLLAIVSNIGVLGFFKYSNFFTSTAFDVVNFFRSNLFHSTAPLQNYFLINVLIPLGISYITFQAIGYLVEIKRGNQAAEKNLGHFSTFLLFFPKIVARQ